MDRMGRSGFQMSVAGLLGLVACVAVNIWLFRVGVLFGLIGLNVTKHVGVAVLCQVVGVNRKDEGRSTTGDRGPSPPPHAIRGVP